MYTTTRPRVAFDSLGHGETDLLYLPGWCANRTVFRPLLPLAARAHRALALDWRGHGDSDAPSADFGEADLVEDALAVIAAADADRVIPVALAHSGWVAIELRRRLGADRVPGLVLLDWMPLGAPAPFFVALEGLQDPTQWQSVRAGLFEMWTTGLDIPALDAHIAEMGHYGAAMWARAGREIATSFGAYGTPLAAIDALGGHCPTLHVYAQPADEEFFVAQQQFAAEHPWFHVARLAARSHFPMFELPEALQAAIDDFVATVCNATSRPRVGQGLRACTNLAP